MEVNLRINSDFRNPYYRNELVRQEVVPVTDYYRLRVWKEHFFRYTDSPHDP